MLSDRRFPRLVWPLTLMLMALVASAASPVPPATATERTIRLADAAEMGTFNVGSAESSFRRLVAPDVSREVLRLDFNLPPGTAAGLWAKRFPEGFRPDQIDVVKPAVRIGELSPIDSLVVELQIKGETGIQKIPLELRKDWTFREQPMDWKAIGNLTEVVVSVSRTNDRPGESQPAVGSLELDVRFETLTLFEKLGRSSSARYVGVVLIAGLAWLLLTLLHLVFRPLHAVEAATGADGGVGRRPGPAKSGWHGLGRDLVHGVGLVALACLALGIDRLGTMGRLEVGWLPLGFAIGGAAIAAWWKYGTTGRHLTAGEAFQDVLATGLLAVSASPLAILQTPAAWPEVVMLSAFVAATAAFLYHAVNANRLAVSGKHLPPILGALIVATPYAVGGLTLLGAHNLVQALGEWLTLRMLEARPEAARFLGQVAILFGFNALVANALGLATNRRMLRSARAHGALLIVAIAAIAAPWVAALGSGAWAASWSEVPRLLIVVATTVFSQAGLWAEVYLLTGMILDAIHAKPPSNESSIGYASSGAKKGMVYSGVFMGGLSLLGVLSRIPSVRQLAISDPLPLATLCGALVFPLLKTIIETFDGSQAFFPRLRQSYRNPILALRGAVVGLGLGYALTQALAEESMLRRVWFGLGIGVAALAGINLLRDWVASWRGQGRIQPPRVYFVQAMLGGAIGAALGFYFDATQLTVVISKFQQYVNLAQEPRLYDVRPLLSNWGYIALGNVSGGPSLLFAEALGGVIEWSIPAWLFTINRTFMAAYFEKQAAPIQALFTRAGLVQLVENMLGVLRWGLWMSPIIKSFLRPMGEPTWYNQDGAIHTLVAIVQNATMSHVAFRESCLQAYIALMAYDWVRILIWLDHMGLRVATLVNLSFLGMDRLDRRLARFLAPAATAICIPEGIKRFTTWAPLLIPFYIPRGRDWDIAWNQSQALRNAPHESLVASILSLSPSVQGLLLVGATAASTAAFATARQLRLRASAGRPAVLTLGNSGYEVTLKENGETYSQVKGRHYDVSRRSYDFLDPAGRTVYLVETVEGTPAHAWPLIGNVPGGLTEFDSLTRHEHSLVLSSTRNEIRTTIAIAPAGHNDTAELWSITLENLSDRPRELKVVPYLEWVLNQPEADRGHTQYNRLFAEMEYTHGLHSVLAWDKHAKAMGVLASDIVPEGFLSSRVDFLGRARSLGKPRVLETLAFVDARDTDAHPTFDPIGSLLLNARLAARGSTQVRLLIGLVADKPQAIDLVARHLQIPGAESVAATRRRKTSHPIGHGEIPPGTPQPYTEFDEDGRSLRVLTPFTTRPYDHTLSNRLGHVVAVTNRGLHTSSSVNSQQNRLTPDWADTVTREVPSEAFYLYDPAAREWFSPTYHPLNDASAVHEAEFSVDGSAIFRMTKGPLETELTVFVPPQEPVGIYRLTLKNLAPVPRSIRIAPYFQMVLAGQPEYSGPLRVRSDASLNALFYENPRNTYRTGPAFVAVSCEAQLVETTRGRFFGKAARVASPYLVEHGEPDPAGGGDDRPIASFLVECEIPAGGERSLVVVLGQADDRARAERVIRELCHAEASLTSLEATRNWWLGLMDTLTVRTSRPDVDRYLDWLKYQALAERIWARRGFYQASGAFGFRDQLQDSVNLLWVDPALARKQLLLHASQQFREGDVVHWFHQLQDGRTGFSGRTHASDNLLWLAWGVVEYLSATGDHSLLAEQTPYLESEQPLAPLPAGKHGMGFDPLRSSREDSVYRHCMKAIDLVLEKRMGVHGLPLMGTGDWNDGLDEIGSQGKGESIWLGFFLYYILDRMIETIGREDGPDRQAYYLGRLQQLKEALELTWRGDRYLRAFHDDGTEIGVKGSGIWEIDALTAAWAVMAGINPERGRIVFETALEILEQEKTILLGWPPLREDTKPYLGRSSAYPEGVRENGMYCHGVQWLVGAARILAEQASRDGKAEEAQQFRDTAFRLWLKITPIPHTLTGEIETYGGQPNKQAADLVTTFDPGRMIWNGYTGAAGWLFRQAIEGVLGLRLIDGEIVPPVEFGSSGDLTLERIDRDLSRSPLAEGPQPRPRTQTLTPTTTSNPSF